MNRAAETVPPDAFAARLGAVAAATEVFLDRLLAPDPVNGEIARPARLVAAMRHGSLGGGKRIRPFLVTESAGLFGMPLEEALPAAAALECVHCYSLVHDDLPAMDDDELRRGQPTVHKAFDEATAILAGDGLLTLAFDILGRPETHADLTARIALVQALARAAGLGGMVGGQMLDLEAEGRFARQPTRLNDAEIKRLQAMKTGALLQCACLFGGILGRADVADHQALARYGAALGEAFQIADDLLDREGDAAVVGKSTGKDAAAGKATFVEILGVDGARRRLAVLVGDAVDALAGFGPRGGMLRAAAHFVAQRRA